MIEVDELPQPDPPTQVDLREFRNGHEPRDNDIFIAVMGVTGACKSSLISHLVSEGVGPVIGQSLSSCTTECSVYCFAHSEDTHVYLIDTPGFDDTNRTDADILSHLAAWLAFTYSQGIRLHGILYLHRITDPRMQGSAKKNLIMFHKLCGDHALRKVTLVTTMWEKLEMIGEGEKRENELRDKDEFWGWMVKRGSRIERHANNAQSANRLVEMFIPPEGRGIPENLALQIQEEMADQHKLLKDTKAGEAVCDSIAKEKHRIDQALEECKQSAGEAILEMNSGRQQVVEDIKADMRKQEDLLLRQQESLCADMKQMVRTRLDQVVAEMEDEKLRRLSSQYSIRSGSNTDIGTPKTTASSESSIPSDPRPILAQLQRHANFKSNEALSLSLRGRHCSFIGPAYIKS